MEAATNTVSAVFTYHGETFAFGIFLDGGANGAQADARFHHFDAQIQALLRDAAQTLAENGRFADDKHLRGIAVEFIFNHGHVDVDDITIFQMFSVIRNAVAHHFINRDTDGFRIAVVAEAGGDRVLFVNDVIVTDTVQFAGGDARFDIRFDHFQHFGCQTARDAHFFDVFRCLDRDSHEFCPSVPMISAIIV
ncbi:hypothetical protein CDS [Salmonella enterica subsp. enterica serovar Derby]|nr:hypothetical protein CDS [Salmonella enterica subsp. enterica serovar Derby]